MPALAAIQGGTLCVWRNQLPEDFDEIISALRRPSERALLIVCAHALPRGNDIASQIVTVGRSVLIPPLADRTRELHRIIDEYAADAIAEFGGGSISAADREWVANSASGSLHQLGMAIRRIVALHACRGIVTQAAKLLEVTHGSLSVWLARRTIPDAPGVPCEDDEDATEDT